MATILDKINETSGPPPNDAHSVQDCSSVSGSGKMSQIARCVWLPERARWSYLARSGPPAVSREKNITSLAGYWPRSFFASLYLDSVSVHKHAKKELGQCPAILTTRLVDNTYIIDLTRP